MEQLSSIRCDQVLKS